MFNYSGNNLKINIYTLSHSYLNINCANPLTLKFMPGHRDNGCHYAHTWDSPGAGLCEHATFGSVKGHLKVIAIQIKKVIQVKPYCPLLDRRNV